MCILFFSNITHFVLHISSSVCVSVRSTLIAYLYIYIYMFYQHFHVLCVTRKFLQRNNNIIIFYWRHRTLCKPNFGSQEFLNNFLGPLDVSWIKNTVSDKNTLLSLDPPNNRLFLILIEPLGGSDIRQFLWYLYSTVLYIMYKGMLSRISNPLYLLGSRFSRKPFDKKIQLFSFRNKSKHDFPSLSLLINT